MRFSPSVTSTGAIEHTRRQGEVSRRAAEGVLFPRRAWERGVTR